MYTENQKKRPRRIYLYMFYLSTLIVLAYAIQTYLSVQAVDEIIYKEYFRCNT